MNNPRFFLGIGLAFVIIFAGVSVYTHYAGSGPAPVPADHDTLYQVSTIDALMLGVYDGITPIRDLKSRGDFGIGTFDALDGEMIVLDGIVYQVKADGRILSVPDNLTTPFATVTHFEADRNITTKAPMNLSVFTTSMEEQLPTGNMIYAVRMHGTFPFMKVRSVPAQQEPYQVLSEAVKNQSVYTFSGTTGTVVGFYTPIFFKGVNVPGFHLHYLSDDRTTGGHILDFTLPAGTLVEYDITPGFTMALPTSGDFTGADLSQDLSSDLAKIEK
ncbi:acetolactate decarboxylase [Methanoregula sp.]|uniref:acetolactate decarboxylase n=1 Tax=Methanoregula sp. TaxID=2052170 RepID=UPI000CB3183D|nr:acetolactate decarboxylase [Methanoregula sp.]PKG32742.1 MAG: acetolactate decarboxylase [Methanoregula sp.]